MIRELHVGQGCEIEFTVSTLDGKQFTVRGLAEHPIRLTNAVIRVRDLPPPQVRKQAARRLKRNAKRRTKKR